MPSMADAARRPMPAAPPMMARPAPMPAAKYARALGSIEVPPERVVDGDRSSMRGVGVHADEDRSEQREDVGLDEGDQDLEQHDEEAERDRDRAHQPPARPVELGEEGDEQEQRRDHHMPGQP